jgi:hypothetical protein
LKWDGSTMLRLRGLGMYAKILPCLFFPSWCKWMKHLTKPRTTRD